MGRDAGQARSSGGSTQGSTAEEQARWEAPLAALLSAAVAGLLLAPVAPAPRSLALGHPENDVWNHVWGYHWAAGELLSGRLPTSTPALNWPEGGSLWFVDLLGVILALPAHLAAGPVAAYNLSCLWNFWLAGFAAWGLARRVSGSAAGALFAGLAFALSPHLLGQAYNGISETLTAGWLPLCLWVAHVAADRGQPRWWALTGLCWGLCTLASWYYGLSAGLFLLGGLAAQLWQRRSTRLGPGEALAWLRSGASAGLALLATAGPALYLFFRSMAAEDAVVKRDPDFVWSTLIMHNMTDLWSLLRPGRVYSPDLLQVFGEHLIAVVYLGHGLLWPALAALLLARRGAARPWAWAALGFLLLTLGPFLYVGGDYVQVAGGWVPLPFLALFKAVPIFSRISHAYRFVLPLGLCLCILSAQALRGLSLRGWPVWPLAIGLILARGAESLLWSQAVWPLPATEIRPPAIYAALQDGAVLDLPVGLPVLGRARYFAAQMVHNQPIPYGLNDPTPPVLYYNRYSRYLLELERSTVELLPAELPALDLEMGRRSLRDAGLRWIVVHLESYPSSQRPKLLHFLDDTATPVHEGEGLRIYRLDP